MKTLFNLSMTVLLLIATQLFWGCEKKPIIVPPVVLQPTVELTITPTGTLKYGDNCTITWTSTNANGGVFLNNQSVGISGGIAKKLFRDTTFILRGVNGSLTATNQKDVTVGNWTTSKFGLVSYYPWKLKEIRIVLVQNGVVVYREDPTDEEKTRIFYYHKNGNMIRSFNTKSSVWKISEDGLFLVEDLISWKFYVSQTELIFCQETTWSGQPAYFENVYEHASNVPTDK